MTARFDAWADTAIRAVLAIVLVLTAYVAYTYWASTRVPTDAAVGQSKEQLQAMLARDAKSVPALSGLAALAMQDNDLETAKSYWTRALAQLTAQKATGTDPQLEQAYYGLGVVYLELKQYQVAVTNLQQSAKLKDDASDTHYMLSVAFRELGDTAKQRAELLTTLAFDPTYPQGNYDLGLVVLGSGDVAAAAEYFRIAADGAPATVTAPQDQLDKLAVEKSEADRLAAAAAIASTDASAAIVEARIAAAIAPTDTKAIRLVATLWEKLGQKDKALNAYRRLKEVQPGDVEADRAIKRLTDGK